MPSRFEYERAIRDSELPPLSRLLTLTLATWADVKTGIIPAHLTPSLSMLESATGMDRSTVRRHLNKLEKDGWVGRDRPAVADARSKKARTRYSLAVPAGVTVPESDGNELGAQDPEARGTQPLVNSELGAHSPMARGTQPLELGAENPMTRGTVPLSSSSSPSSNFLKEEDGGGPRIAASCKSLVDAMTAAGIHVSWELTSAEWILLETIITRTPEDVLVDHAIESWHAARTPPRLARYFLTGWRGMAVVPNGAPRKPAMPARQRRPVGSQTPEDRGVF